MPRPTLLPGLRPLWRNRYSVQLGTDPALAVVLELPHPAAAKLLDLLDGSRTERAVIAEMAHIGLPEPDTRAALATLAEAGLVVAAHTLMPSALPAERRRKIATEAAAIALRYREHPTSPAAILRRRYEARVIVAGDGPITRLLVSTLSEAGVGTVGWVGEAGAAARPVVSTTSCRTVRADEAFVVQLGRLAGVTQRGARRRGPHLAIGVRDAVAIVGPLVPPGGSPCLRCLDLHRTDRDPAWPRLAAQLAALEREAAERDAAEQADAEQADAEQADAEQADAERADAEGRAAHRETVRREAARRETAMASGWGGLGPCAAATLTTAAGFAAAEVLAYLDGGEPTTIGTTVEINGVAPWRRRRWTAHPRCDCARRGAS